MPYNIGKAHKKQSAFSVYLETTVPALEETVRVVRPDRSVRQNKLAVPEDSPPRVPSVLRL